MKNRSLTVFKGLLILAVVSLTTMVDVSAKKKEKTDGKSYYARKEYALAIPQYEKEMKGKKTTKQKKAQIEAQIGMCYYYLNKPKEAVSWLRKGFAAKFESDEAYAVYGLSLQKLERYEEAITAFEQCRAKNKKYPNLDLYVASCHYALDHPDPGLALKMRSSSVNTAGSEYGISPVKDGEVFFSRAATKGRDLDPRTGLGFTEVFSATMDGGDLTDPKKEKEFMKMYYNTGVFAFDSVGNYMYMTTCDNKSGKCGIYRSKFDRRKWGKPEPVFVSKDYDMAHPALAMGGTRLYFTSNAKSGEGKTDLWYVDRLDNIWSEPVNLGKNINTPEREEFPWVMGDTILYFASNGHPGFGGLDIFAVAIEDDGSFGELMNLGRPFNSGADDFNLTSSEQSGLLVSSRTAAQSDNIFVFNKDAIPSPARKEKPKPEPEPEPIVEPTPEPTPEPKPVPVEPISDVLATIYFDFDNFIAGSEYKKKYDEYAAIIKSYPNAVFEIAGHTDRLGGKSLNVDLSQKRAEYVARQLRRRGIRPEQLVVKAYGKSKPAVPNAKTEDDFAKNRRVQIIMMR